jgi:hypothetical protein
VLFTFYMVTDPGTTPSKPLDQIIFGVSVAFVYGILMAFHVVFGLFFALTIVCSIRGLNLYLQEWLASPFLPKFSPSAIPLVSEPQR